MKTHAQASSFSKRDLLKSVTSKHKSLLNIIMKINFLLFGLFLLILTTSACTEELESQNIDKVTTAENSLSGKTASDATNELAILNLGNALNTPNQKILGLDVLEQKLVGAAIEGEQNTTEIARLNVKGELQRFAIVHDGKAPVYIDVTANGDGTFNADYFLSENDFLFMEATFNDKLLHVDKVYFNPQNSKTEDFFGDFGDCVEGTVNEPLFQVITAIAIPTGGAGYVAAGLAIGCTINAL